MAKRYYSVNFWPWFEFPRSHCGIRGLQPVSLLIPVGKQMEKGKLPDSVPLCCVVVNQLPCLERIRIKRSRGKEHNACGREDSTEEGKTATRRFTRERYVASVLTVDQSPFSSPLGRHCTVLLAA